VVDPVDPGSADPANRGQPDSRGAQSGYKAGGSSLRDHRQTSGELGYFKRSFQVYDREGKTCESPGCGGIVRRFTQNGRSTFWCPKCQR
jgi:formamidopyrimidine-DNA glycosylase